MAQFNHSSCGILVTIFSRIFRRTYYVQILEQLCRHGPSTLRGLAKLLNTSPKTLYKYVFDLSSVGLIVIVRSSRVYIIDIPEGIKGELCALLTSDSADS